MQGMLKSLTGRILIVLMLSNSAFVFGATCLIQSYPENSLAKIDNEYLKADKISLVDKQILKLYGEIELGLERGFLKADTAILNKTANTIKGIKNGEVLFSDALFQFQNGSINRNTGQINLENGNAILKNKKLKFQFKDLSSIDRSELLFRDVSFSSCSEPSKGWEISAKEVLVNQESKRGVINVLELKIFENRLFRLPKVPFPATDQRLSGILEPDIAITSDGIDFYIPFYIVTSQKSDITVAPRLINERGLGIESNVRYLSGGRLNQINVLYFDNDKKFHNNQEKRWAVNANESILLPWGKLSIDWSKASDPLVLNDLGSDLDQFSNRREYKLKQNVELDLGFKNGSLKLSQEGYQILNPLLPFKLKKSPAINFNYINQWRNILMDWSLSSEKFENDGPLGSFYFINNQSVSPINNREGRRQSFSLEIIAFANLDGTNIELSNEIIYKNYHLKNKYKDHDNFLITKLKLDKVFLKTNSNGYELIKPQIGFGYTDFTSQSENPIFDLHPYHVDSKHLISESRLLGIDRILDEEYVYLGIDWEKKYGDLEIRTYLARKNFLNDSKVLNELYGLDSSKDNLLILNASIRNNNLMFFTNATYEKKSDALNKGDIGLKYNNGDEKVYIARRFRKGNEFSLFNELDYLEFGLEKYFGGGYQLLAGTKQDLNQNKNIESFIGVGYESCCFAWRIYASDKRLSGFNSALNSNLINASDIFMWKEMIQLENKSRISFEFELKGLTGPKNKLAKMFTQSLWNL